MLLHSILSLYGVGGWMNETRARSPHSSCWDCSCNFRAFRVSVNLPRNPVPETGCVLSRKTGAEEPVYAIPKTSDTGVCKMLTIVLLTPICITCPQCLFVLVLCSDRQFPKDILNCSSKLSKSLFNRYHEDVFSLSHHCWDKKLFRSAYRPSEEGKMIKKS